MNPADGNGRNDYSGVIKFADNKKRNMNLEKELMLIILAASGCRAVGVMNREDVPEEFLEYPPLAGVGTAKP
jgi:hypothetical protein